MKRVLLILFLLGLMLASGAAGYGWYLVQQPYRTHSGSQVVDIPFGVGSEEIVDLLVAKGVIGYRYPALAYLYFSAYRGKLQAGEYLFEQAMNVEEVFEKLGRGDVRLYTFTVPEGLRLDEIALLWEEARLGLGQEFLEAAVAALPKVQQIDPGAVSTEGYLFPETYSFPRGVTAAEGVEAMIRGFEDAVARLAAQVDPGQWRLDLNRTLILASLIESEAAVADEREVISSVFMNRLDRGMRLECDPTVIYALVLEGSYRGRLLREDLGFDSPYNTYINADLPPGPISNPGYASLRAAVSPADTNFYYFVRTDGGRHTFSRTLTEHNRAVAAYRQGTEP